MARTGSRTPVPHQRINTNHNNVNHEIKSILTFFLLEFFFSFAGADKLLIKIETERISLIHQVADNGRLYQKYLGKKLNHDSDIQYLPQGTEAYLTHGMEDYF